MKQQALQESLNRISELNNEDLSMLLSCAENRKLKKGESVLKEGDVCRSFYLVDKGYLRTWYNKNGVPINLNFTFEGDFTSNFKSFKSRQPSEYIIEAGETSSVWVFDFNIISTQYKGYPQITLFIRRLAIRLLLAADEHSNLFKMYTPTERYRYIEKNKPQLLQRISLSQLASYIGITRETLSRIRSKSH
jgi:CRP-like cAMP-binding protein